MNKHQERANFTWSSNSSRIFNVPSHIAKETFFYVQEVGYFLTSPPYFTERTNLDSFLIIYTLSGSGTLSYLKGNYQLTKGTIAYIDCKHYNFYKCDTSTNWEFLWLHCNGKSAQGYYDIFIKLNFRVLNNINTFLVENNLRRILSLTQKKDVYSDIIVSNLITNLLTEFLIKNSTETFEIKVAPDYIKTLLGIIDKSYNKELSLNYLSTEIGVSKFHLSREFKRYIGVSLKEYIIITRLNKSKDYLRYSGATIEDISYKCGFNSVNHYINMFKSREGITPLQYRKKW
ncbi:MAG: AraC family transcriptional regulator [Lachnospirales bacterium]